MYDRSLESAGMCNVLYCYTVIIDGTENIVHFRYFTVYWLQKPYMYICSIAQFTRTQLEKIHSTQFTDSLNNYACVRARGRARSLAR